MTGIVVTESLSEERRIEHACASLYARIAHLMNASKSAEHFDTPSVPEVTIPEIFDEEKHIKYCESALKWPLPGAYISLDASKTWIVYWALHSLSLLNARNVIDAHAGDIIDFLSRCQNPTGGFGGGPGQISHLATTYPAVAALAIIGTERAISVVNRQTLRTWLVSLKDPEGGFKIHDDGEVDMRSCYCAIICASMMGILDEEVASGVSEHILSCQRYDGGFAGEPGAESHSGYTYCALAALALLGTLKDADLMKLMAWLSHRQTPAGGFNGRANKLVDVCYSFWVSGSLVLLKLGLWQQAKTRSNVHVPLPGTLFCSPTPLQKYITFCCQPSLQGWDEETRTILDSSKKGGLCDKPGTKPDFYHTCYGLSGLSIVQEYSKLQVQESEKDQHLQEQLPKLNITHPLYNVCEDVWFEFVKTCESKLNFKPQELQDWTEFIESERNYKVGNGTAVHPA